MRKKTGAGGEIMCLANCGKRVCIGEKGGIKNEKEVLASSSVALFLSPPNKCIPLLQTPQE